MKFSDLQEVQSQINLSVAYMTDKENYDQLDQWEVAEHMGDCEDYALRKLHELLNRGWPIEQLRLATCWCENSEYHAVLIVHNAIDESNGYAGNYVLDNRFPYIYQVDSGYMGTKYKWDKIQKFGGSQEWEKM